MNIVGRECYKTFRTFCGKYYNNLWTLLLVRSLKCAHVCVPPLPISIMFCAYRSTVLFLTRLIIITNHMEITEKIQSWGNRNCNWRKNKKILVEILKLKWCLSILSNYIAITIIIVYLWRVLLEWILCPGNSRLSKSKSSVWGIAWMIYFCAMNSSSTISAFQWLIMKCYG